jgi:hypothetical protein
MATTSELDYSGTAGSNTDIGGVSIAENIPPANLNDAIRNMAAFRHDATTHRVDKAAGSYNPVKADHNQLWLCTGAATIALPATIPANGWSLWVKAAGADCSISVSGGGSGFPYTLVDGSTVKIIATNVSGDERYDIIASHGSSGLFTPVLSFNGASTGVTYSSRYGVYMQEGSHIFISIYIALFSKGSSTGDLSIDGLPFSVSAALGRASFAVGHADDFVGLTGSLYASTPASGDSISIEQSGSTGVSGVTNSFVTNTTIIAVSGHYTI